MSISKSEAYNLGRRCHLPTDVDAALSVINAEPNGASLLLYFQQGCLNPLPCVEKSVERDAFDTLMDMCVLLREKMILRYTGRHYEYGSTYRTYETYRTARFFTKWCRISRDDCGVLLLSLYRNPELYGFPVSLLEIDVDILVNGVRSLFYISVGGEKNGKEDE